MPTLRDVRVAGGECREQHVDSQLPAVERAIRSPGKTGEGCLDGRDPLIERIGVTQRPGLIDEEQHLEDAGAVEAVGDGLQRGRKRRRSRLSGGVRSHHRTRRDAHQYGSNSKPLHS